MWYAYFDPLYWILILVGGGLSLGASLLVKGTFSAYSNTASRTGMTGAQVAQQSCAPTRSPTCGSNRCRAR